MPPSANPRLVGRQGGRCWVGRTPTVVPERVHVQVAAPADPLLALLQRQRGDQPQQGWPVGEDPDDPRPPFELLVEPLQPVGRADARLMGERECEARQTRRELLFEGLDLKRLARTAASLAATAVPPTAPNTLHRSKIGTNQIILERFGIERNRKF